MEKDGVFMDNLRLWEVYKTITSEEFKWVDLSRPLEPETPHYGGFPGMEINAIYDYEKTDCNFRAHVYSTVGQCGTHVDPPVHFHKEGRALDEIQISEMVLPLCVIDLVEEVEKNPDYELTVKDIEAWESKHGKIPAGSFVAFHSGWAKRKTIEEIENVDANGQSHYPGWGLDALKFLIEERNVTAIGHEPSDTDPAAVASTVGWVGEDYYLHQDRYQIEMMTNLDQCPEVGGIIFCTFPKITGGSGFPARCFALVPKAK